MNTHQLILLLLGFSSNLRLAHWQADTRLNTHRVLGELYEALDSSIDELSEVVMGKDGQTSFIEESVMLSPNSNLAVLFANGEKVVSDLRAQFKAGDDDDVLNILADINGKMNRARYLLKIGSNNKG